MAEGEWLVNMEPETHIVRSKNLSSSSSAKQGERLYWGGNKYYRNEILLEKGQLVKLFLYLLYFPREYI